MTTLHRIVAYAVARRVGMPIVVDEKHKGDPRWDGTILHIAPTSDEWLTHEIGHYLAAKGHGEEKLPDFGCTKADYATYLGDPTANARDNEADRLQRVIEMVIDAAVREVGRI